MSIPLGTAPLFGSAPPGGVRRYRVTDGRTWGPATTSLALAAAQVRAPALTGQAALVWADDATSVTGTLTPDGALAVESDPQVGWATQCRTLLDRHG